MEQKAHPKQVPKKILARTTVKWHVSLVTIKSVYGKKWESVTPMMEQNDGTFPSFISGIDSNPNTDAKRITYLMTFWRQTTSGSSL
jgi:hypothetical protein